MSGVRPHRLRCRAPRYGGRDGRVGAGLRAAAGADRAAPGEPRDASRLLVYERATGAIRHRRFAELEEELARRARRRQRHEGRAGPDPDRRRRRARCSCSSGSTATSGRALARPTRRLRAGRRYGPGRAAGAPRGGPLARPPPRRARRRDAAAAVHHRAARGSLALPDRLRARAGLGRGADRRPPLHARAARAPAPRARDAPRRPRHLPARRGGAARGAPDPRRALRGRGGGVGADPCRRPRARRRHDDGARARDARARCPARRPHRAVRRRRRSSSAASTRSSRTSTCPARRCSRS